MITEQERQKWLEKRRNYTTASDAFSLLRTFDNPKREYVQSINIDKIKYLNKTPFQMYHEKVLHFDRYAQFQGFTFTKSMGAGNKQEDVIGNYAEEDLGLELTPNGDHLAVLEGHKIAATCDYSAKISNLLSLRTALTGNLTGVKVLQYDDTIDLTKDGVCECKLTYEFNPAKLIAYQVQVQQQLLCTGKTWGVIAIGIHEQGDVAKITERKYYFVKSDPEFAEAIKIASQNYWTYLADVESGAVPVPKVDLDNERDKKLNAFVEEDIGLLCKQYYELYDAIKKYDKTFDAIKARLKYHGAEGTFEAKYEGEIYQIPISRRNNTYWTEEAINNSKIKLEGVKVGDLRTAGTPMIKQPKKLSKKEVDNKPK